MSAITEDVPQLLHSMASQLQQQLTAAQITQPCMVGIHTGGVWVARELHRLLGLDTPLGTLDISFYRDDFSRIGMHPQVKPSELPFEVEDRPIILVDDVLQSGRTIRAAMNEIFDYGRPSQILLAVLVERPGRELPIQADVCGLRVELNSQQQIKLHGPESLSLSIQEVS
ncbi:MAG: bifunctional pyr operon transcriptional regulator/uracil phosphoribosyltransferase PyrR [Chromatiales bacterium]|nr:bifunctional pyr operon transcriptional regulator/uracil phosphoribosyltransferase PyrR [Gammaproteobacteria bacterium]MBW6475665.1 bifunctional pyr operon transcriptional regulator/uracil phosphoribosyltransferase PyrR [Chromatiales bacterium]